MRCIAGLMIVLAMIGCNGEPTAPTSSPNQNQPGGAFDPNQVVAVAVYKAKRETGYKDVQRLQDTDVVFDVTDAATVQQLVKGIDWANPLNAKMLAIPHAAIFFKLKDGSIRRGYFLDKYRYIDFPDDRLYTYKVDPAAGYEKYAKEVPK